MITIKRFLRSPRTVIILIILVGISCLIAITVPQLGEKKPQFFENWSAKNPSLYRILDLLQFNHVYTSIWFLVLVSLIAASLTLTVWDQGKIALKAYRQRRRPFELHDFKNFSSLTVTGHGDLTAVIEAIQAVFKSNKYKICYEDKSEVISLGFFKNEVGRWGGVILHAGFLCVIIAALYGLAFQKRGFIQSIETETFSGRNADLLSRDLGILSKEFNLDFQVYLKRFIPIYWDNDKVRSLQSELSIIDETGPKDVVLNVSSPVKHKGVTLYQSFYYGYALTFVLNRQTGQPVMTHFLLDAPKQRNKPFVGKTDFPTTDYVMKMKFYPNLIEPSFYLAFPGVDLTVTKQGTVLFKDRLLFNQQASFGNDTLHFAQIHYWSGISFVKSSGLTLIYIGFVVSCLGSFLIYFIIHKEIYVKVFREGNDTVVKIGGRARKYQALFAEEFNKICQAIKAGMEAK